MKANFILAKLVAAYIKEDLLEDPSYYPIYLKKNGEDEDKVSVEITIQDFDANPFEPDDTSKNLLVVSFSGKSVEIKNVFPEEKEKELRCLFEELGYKLS
jgi:hypothetical protein